jgi:flagellar basal-body rod modification protein FlgD
MDVTNIGGTLGELTIPGSQRVDSPSLTQQDFLSLLIEQMRNQNPLEPMDNADFIAQMAQFDTLTAMHQISEALTALASISELSNASMLVGREVTALVPQAPDPESGLPRNPEAVTGTVERVTFDTKGAIVHLDGRPVPATYVVEVA